MVGLIIVVTICLAVLVCFVVRYMAQWDQNSRPTSVNVFLRNSPNDDVEVIRHTSNVVLKLFKARDRHHLYGFFKTSNGKRGSQPKGYVQKVWGDSWVLLL